MQRSRVTGAAACAGALTVTVVPAEADVPRSSTTLQVMVIAPGEAPVVFSVAVPVLPVTVPAVVEYEYVSARLYGLAACAVMVAGSPTFTVEGSAEQLMVGGANA